MNTMNPFHQIFPYAGRLFCLMLLATSISACSALSVYVDPIISATDSKPSLKDLDSKLAEEQELSLRHFSYRFQKKYDLLHASLLREYERHVKAQHILGQLYTTLDLADFFTYGFINYREALEYYHKAEALNRHIDAAGIQEDRDGKTPIVYYQAEGRYALPRMYDFQEISTQIESHQNRIRRLLGEHPEDSATAQAQVFPEIRTVTTDQYAYAIQVSKDVFAPEIFEAFEQKLLSTARAYFRRRYKLSDEEKRYYIDYNVATGFINAFDVFDLSSSQTARILEYIDNAFALDPHEELNEQRIYLHFGKILCLSRLGQHPEAIQRFHTFEQDIETFQINMHAYLDYLQETKTETMIVGFGEILGDSLWGGIRNLRRDLGTIKRERTFVGESEYAKKLNSILNMDEQVQLFRALGSSYHHVGDLEQSIFFNKEAIHIIHNLRSTITSERSRIRFARYKDSLYNILLTDLLARHHSQEAFFYSESSRSRVLVDLLGSRTDLVFKDEKTDAFIREQRNAQVSRDAVRKQTGITDEQVEYIENLQTVVESESGTTKELFSLITVSNLSVPALQTLLPEHVSLVEYYIATDHVYAWVIDREDVTSYLLAISPEELSKEVNSFQRAILTKKTLRMRKRAQYLYNILFAQLEDAIRHPQIYIVPHRFLHVLPFEALLDDQTFLVEKYALAYLPSASVLEFLEPAGHQFQSLLALGNPKIDDYVKQVASAAEKTRAVEFSTDDGDLAFHVADLSLEGAEQEVGMIAKIFPEPNVYVKNAASETVFREHTMDAEVVHIASHGVFDAVDPLSSMLLLSRDTHQDGMLTAGELYGIQTDASLVTLSACETGRADIETGDELLGLVRGFFFAGTSNLIASLWKVDDIATQEFMSLFYTQLASQDLSLAQALQQAKMRMIHNDNYNHPFYWAPFNLYGIGL